MKRKILCFLLVIVSSVSLTGCTIPFLSSDSKSEKKQVEPGYYLSEEELPNDAFYIVHEVTYDKESLDGSKKSVTETRYYPLLQAENTIQEAREEPAGYDASRITWVNHDVDEGAIPTMYAGDMMIYKSPTSIPTKYSLEKFFDEGYTLGVCGLQQDLSGNYRYYSSKNDGNSHTLSTSDATGFDGMDGVESLYLAQVGDQRVTPLNVSPSGTITGLELGEVYDCDIRCGTEKVAAKLTCNVHYFSSAETYFFGSFTFITPIIAQINIPDYVLNGYYNIGNKGFFRYIADESIKDYNDLEPVSYNETIYTYNAEGRIDGTNRGLIFDENGFLVAGVLTDSDGNVIETEGISYEESQGAKTAAKGSTITKPTKLTPKDGYYSGTYMVTNMSEPTYSGSKEIYEIEAVNVDNNEVLTMKYIKTPSSEAVDVTGTYGFVFKEAGNGFDGYEIVTITDASGTDAADPENVDSESTDETESDDVEEIETEE